MDQVGNNVCRCHCHSTFLCKEPEWRCFCNCGTGKTKIPEPNNYKCTDHHLNLVCLGCVMAWIARHNELLNFVKSVMNDDSSGFRMFSTEAKVLLTKLGEL